MAGDVIDLYVVLLDASDSPRAYAECYATLSPEEKDRAGRFAHDRHHRQYVLAHGLLRLALSDITSQVAPSDWSFSRDRYDRPFVASPATARPVYFSLSHTDGCVACAISGFERVGLDVERIQQRGSLRDVVSSACSTEEIETLRGLAPEQFVDRFFDYWTLKEAYLKATGRGLSLPLNQISFLISPDGIAVRLAAGMKDDATNWHFQRKSPSPNHRLAIADGSGVAGGLPILMRQWPLARMS
jgi:4'-phosphopantetheinyl transferase